MNTIAAPATTPSQTQRTGLVAASGAPMIFRTGRLVAGAPFPALLTVALRDLTRVAA